MILTAVLILFGAVCFLYPAVSNIVNEQFNESRIDEYTDNVDAISQNEINRYFSVAEKYIENSTQMIIIKIDIPSPINENILSKHNNSNSYAIDYNLLE